jgi:hypothetical protein
LGKLFIILIFTSLSCTGQFAKEKEVEKDRPVNKIDSPYQWTRVLDSAPWKKNYNFQMLAIRDTIWTFHPDGNWFSTDGERWTKSSLPNSIYNLAFLDYIFFNGAVYGLGYFKGNIEQFTFKPEIYSSTDLKQWVTLSKESNLPNRFFYHPFVFENKIWIIGGEDKNTKYADIWNSRDGINWIKQKDHAAFGKRSGSQVVSLNGKLFLLDNDVWSSPDGIIWQKETDEIVKGVEIFGYSAIVFDHKIWLLGTNRNGQFTSQVLVSEDGRTWVSQDAPWSPRGGIASTVFQGKIYMTGGKYGGMPNQPEFRYSNDLWTLRKKE